MLKTAQDVFEQRRFQNDMEMWRLALDKLTEQRQCLCPEILL